MYNLSVAVKLVQHDLDPNRTSIHCFRHYNAFDRSNINIYCSWARLYTNGSGELVL